MLDIQTPVADLVLDHPETAPVLHRHRIDYCCKGRTPLAQAARDRGLDAGELVGELERAIDERQRPAGADPRGVPTPDLIAQIVGRHHGYLRKALPFLVPLAQKVARVHGEHDPRLVKLRDAVVALASALEPHLEREEAVLFPALLEGGAAETIARELEGMHAEHEEVGELLHTIRAVTADFATPSWACNSYRTLFHELEDLERDVLEHVHLENHVLMPRFAGRA